MIETTNAKLKKWQSGDSVQACFDALNQNADILDAVAANVKKYPSGRMEIEQTIPLTGAISVQWSSSGIYYIEITRSFTEAFIAKPTHVLATVEAVGSAWAWAIVTEVTASSIKIALLRPGSIGSASYLIHVHAIGRWK